MSSFADPRYLSLHATHGVVTRDIARDARLADSVRAGDADALKSLFRTYYDELFAYAASIVGDDAAEDVVQDVFLRIWTRRSTWTPEGEGVVRYLYGATRNRALDVMRAVRRRDNAQNVLDSGQVISPVGTDAVEAAELAIVITRAVEALPPRCREVFTLSRYRRLRQREIAELLGITVNTVNVQLGRALHAIRLAVHEARNGRSGN